MCNEDYVSHGWLNLFWDFWVEKCLWTMCLVLKFLIEIYIFVFYILCCNCDLYYWYLWLRIQITCFIAIFVSWWKLGHILEHTQLDLTIAPWKRAYWLRDFIYIACSWNVIVIISWKWVYFTCLVVGLNYGSNSFPFWMQLSTLVLTQVNISL